MRYDETPSLGSWGLFMIKKKANTLQKKRKNLHILQGHEVCGQPLSVVCTTGEQGFLQLKQAFVSTLFFCHCQQNVLLSCCRKTTVVVVRKQEPFLFPFLFVSQSLRAKNVIEKELSWPIFDLISGSSLYFLFPFWPCWFSKAEVNDCHSCFVFFGGWRGKLLASYIYIEIVWYMRAPM